jgi:hypothetical protein
MYILDNKPLPLGKQFVTSDGTQYPSNWLYLASPEERAAIGITEEPDPPTYDQRFYWGVGNPKDLTELKKLWITQTKATAGGLLSATDWIIIRSNDPSSNKPVSQAVVTERTNIRTASNTKEAAINATTTVDQLAAYITSSQYSDWSQ